ncbi:MAG: helix-turn-helix domain-containing protein [Alphaproteobacteria bacterium]|nr:helix-turn-helix domain-containing protein [Alphaproteobacteria bacterium]
MPKQSNTSSSEARRGNGPADEAYLKLVGERVRVMRLQMGMSRKALSQASGVSERYLAELERGTGNASLLVLRSIADALGTQVHELTVEEQNRPVDTTLAIQHLENLSAAQAIEARQMLTDRFGRKAPSRVARIAIVGLRSAGKNEFGNALAEALQVPFVDLDREVERASGIGVSEIYAVHGEAVFQRLQKECLGNLLNGMPRGVIHSGGDIVTSEETYDLLFAGCLVVWVRASLDEILNGGSDDNQSDGERLAVTAMQPKLEAALAERTPLYEKADAIVDTTGRPVEDAVSDVLEQIRQKAARRERIVA